MYNLPELAKRIRMNINQIYAAVNHFTKSYNGNKTIRNKL